MINSDKNILLQETEIKPNRYATYVLIVSLLAIIFCWILNELDIFRVGKTEMRIGSIIPILLVSFSLFVSNRNEAARANPRTKYFIIASASLLAFTTATLLTFHTTMMLLYPIFIAMLYRSRKLGIFAVTASVFCTIVTPVIAYMLGTWDIELFKELILIGTNGTAVIEGAHPGITLVSVLKILLYLSMPRVTIVGSCSLLLFYIIRVGSDHVTSQIMLNNLSKRDMLTGLYNQNCYKEFLADEHSGKVGIMFFDVNGLKAANDSFGHEYGDLLLKRCAKSLEGISDEDNSAAFRIGGDEFLLVLDNPSENEFEETSRRWQESLENINRENLEEYDGLVCSMAMGYILGDYSDLDELVRSADAKMYRNKALMKAEMRS